MLFHPSSVSTHSAFGIVHFALFCSLSILYATLWLTQTIKKTIPKQTIFLSLLIIFWIQVLIKISLFSRQISLWFPVFHTALFFRTISTCHQTKARTAVERMIPNIPHNTTTIAHWAQHNRMNCTRIVSNRLSLKWQMVWHYVGTDLTSRSVTASTLALGEISPQRKRIAFPKRENWLGKAESIFTKKISPLSLFESPSPPWDA